MQNVLLDVSCPNYELELNCRVWIRRNCFYVRGDVYSFGILMMETFTRKKPTDNMFEERLSLQCWIKEALPHSVTEVADANLLGEENFTAKKDCILSILQVAVDCTVEFT
jgi:LRR receptor-like serine/threonine-protein kinase FLS2